MGRPKGPEKVRRVVYLPPRLATWIREEALRRSTPEKRVGETHVVEDAIDRLMQEAKDQAGQCLPGCLRD